jgi:lipoprotein NlpD
MTRPTAWLYRVLPTPFKPHRSLMAMLVVLLVGCSSGYAPVTDLSVNQNRRVEIVRGGQVQTPVAPNQYRVRRGDTLYSIAFRYGLDYRDLARHNNIRNNYTIYVGQVLTLKASPTRSSTQVASSDTRSQSSSASSSSKASSSKASTSATVSSSSTSTSSSKSASSSKIPVKVASVPKTQTASAVPANTKVQWRWPASGRLLSRFSSKGDLNRGINLAGRTGDPVFAAASGKVVYAGNGLHGYGNLIIINHNQEYLSAYAHNSKILVKENDFVKVGGKIAEIGNSGAVSTMLHFEIRKDGKPVDPLRYLPNR